MATCSGVTSVTLGWQVYKMNSTNLSSISGLSYDNTSGDFTFPAGTFVIQASIVNANSAFGYGLQSSASASTPSSLSAPNLDAWQYTTANAKAGIQLTWTYKFASSNPVRFYLNSASATTLGMASIRIFKIPQ